MRRCLVMVAAALLACACAHPRPASTDGRATVTKVIDGDTIVVRIGGQEEHVRLLGIDTPETHKPDSPVECFGPEAASRLDALLPGRVWRNNTGDPRVTFTNNAVRRNAGARTRSAIALTAISRARFT